jgi:hypothetical protein
MLRNKWLERTPPSVRPPARREAQASRHPAATPLSHTVRLRGGDMSELSIRVGCLIVLLCLAVVPLSFPGDSVVAQGGGSLEPPAVFHTGDRAGQDFIVSIEKTGGTIWVASLGRLSQVGDADTLLLFSLPDTIDNAVEAGEPVASRRISGLSMCPARRDPYDGSIWIGVNDGGPCEHSDYVSIGRDAKSWLKPGGLLVFEAARRRWRFYPPVTGKVSSRTYSLAFDSTSVWVWGQYPLVQWETEGVYRHDRATGAIEFFPCNFRYSPEIGALDCRVSANLLAVLHDDLWFGQAKLDRRTGAWTSYAAATGREDRDVCVVKSDGSRLWLGYNSGRVVCYDPGSDKCESQVLPPFRGAITSLVSSVGYVVAGVGWLQWDRTQNWWTGGGGILVLNRGTTKWCLVDSIPGIPSQAVTALLLDGDMLWVGTSKGLVRWSLPGLLSRCKM